ncbi:hypothetical protein ACLOJK_039205 [Asimina triloba]
MQVHCRSTDFGTPSSPRSIHGPPSSDGDLHQQRWPNHSSTPDLPWRSTSSPSGIIQRPSGHGSIKKSGREQKSPNENHRISSVFITLEHQAENPFDCRSEIQARQPSTIFPAPSDPSMVGATAKPTRSSDHGAAIGACLPPISRSRSLVQRSRPSKSSSSAAVVHPGSNSMATNQQQWVVKYPNHRRILT